MTRRPLVAAVTFGSVDGIGLAIGICLVLHGKAAAVLIAAAAANAAAELAGMASGQWLSTPGEALRVPRSLANGAGAFLGALAPVLALALAGPWAAIVVLVGMALLIAHAMPSEPYWRSYLDTGVTLALVIAVCAVAALVV